MAGFHRINGDFVVRTALDVTDEQDVYETGYWVAPKYAGHGMATEATNAAIRYAFGHLGAKAISIGYFDGNERSRRIVEKLRFQKTHRRTYVHGTIVPKTVVFGTTMAKLVNPEFSVKT